MIAIHTKYLPATNNCGPRVKAYTVTGHSITIPYPHDFAGERAHYQAVKALVEKEELSWDISDMYWGDSSDGKGYVFVFAKSKVMV